MNFDEALAVVYDAFKDVFKRDPFAPSEKIIFGSDRVKESINNKIGVEPICTSNSTMSDIAHSIMDSAK
jgi:hypothetical protein